MDKLRRGSGTVSVYLNGTAVDTLDELAGRYETSRSSVVRRALRDLSAREREVAGEAGRQNAGQPRQLRSGY